MPSQIELSSFLTQGNSKGGSVNSSVWNPTFALVASPVPTWRSKSWDTMLAVQSDYLLLHMSDCWLENRIGTVLCCSIQPHHGRIFCHLQDLLKLSNSCILWVVLTTHAARDPEVIGKDFQDHTRRGVRVPVIVLVEHVDETIWCTQPWRCLEICSRITLQCYSWTLSFWRFVQETGCISIPSWHSLYGGGGPSPSCCILQLPGLGSLSMPLIHLLFPNVSLEK